MIDKEDFKAKVMTLSNKDLLEFMDFKTEGYYSRQREVCLEELKYRMEATEWHYPSKGEIPDKDYSKHPANISKECFVLSLTVLLEQMD